MMYNGTYRQKILCWIFPRIYSRWFSAGEIVVKVKGWRTALVDNKWGKRETMSPCFKIFGITFD